VFEKKWDKIKDMPQEEMVEYLKRDIANEYRGWICTFNLELGYELKYTVRNIFNKYKIDSV